MAIAGKLEIRRTMSNLSMCVRRDAAHGVAGAVRLGSNKVETPQSGISVRLGFVSALLSMLFAASCFAQTAPNAGLLLQQQPKAPRQAPGASRPTIEQPSPTPAGHGPRILVKAIHITGNKLIGEAELQAQLHGLVGRRLTLQQLQMAALALTGYYAGKGYVARVYLPPQEIKQGVVTYHVVEGARGEVTVQSKGKRVSAARVRRFIDARVSGGAPLDLKVLGEALNIVNAQPGVAATASLAPGSREGTVKLNVTAQATPLLGARVAVNNQGSRATGLTQANALVTLANPTGHFDALTLMGNKSQGSSYGYGDYSLAVGDRGLRVGVNGSTLHYHVVQASLGALGANGNASTVGLRMSYPLWQMNDSGLNLSGDVERRHLVDNTLAGQISDRVVSVASLAVNGYRFLPGRLLRGIVSYDGRVEVGDVQQRNAGARAADRAGRHVQGRFVKFAWDLRLARPLSERWTLTAGLRGQVSNKNLDSSEQFWLGGPNRIEAYPVSEATGDEGWMARLAVNRQWGAHVNVAGFIEAGGIRVNHSPVPLTRHNDYTLSGAGLALEWQPTAWITASGSVAAPLGNNPGADPKGNNIDGTGSHSARAWLSVVARF